jgi:hypothetical protein
MTLVNLGLCFGPFFIFLTKFAIQGQIIVKYKEIATFMVASH